MLLFPLSYLLQSLAKWRPESLTAQHAENIAQFDLLIPKLIETLEKESKKGRQRDRRIKALKKRMKKGRRQCRHVESLLQKQSRDVTRLKRRLRKVNTRIARMKTAGARNAGPQIRPGSPDVFNEDPPQLAWPPLQINSHQAHFTDTVGSYCR
ncbi:hypothetical protein LX36DRAFT_663818 [Colletotrichum falcatum]|nr:hypothetical protein LX36DRAFT_663818 [Colletotrichum falcatum]